MESDSPPIKELPWPWVNGTFRPSTAVECNFKWPKISIVTPSYNQGAFIEETIRSVLLQSYPDLEYIIIDGGSTDGTVEIIKKYERWITYWVSEKDRGQCEAINKGFAKASGDVLGWLCSDDVYAPGSLHRVAQKLRDTRSSMAVGASVITRGPETLEGSTDRRQPSYPEMAYNVRTFPQPSVFWRRELWEAAGPLREDLYYVMDYDLWLRMVPLASAVFFMDEVLSYQRTHANQKSANLVGPAHLFLKMRAQVALRAALRRGESRLGWVYRVWRQKFSENRGWGKFRAAMGPGFHWQALRTSLLPSRFRTG